MNKVSLVVVSCCSNTELMRDDPHWTSRNNSLENYQVQIKLDKLV